MRGWFDSGYFMLRCVQLGISIRDLDLLTIGLMNGKIDGAEFMFGEEMLCTSKEEHKALFGDSGDWDDSDDDLDDDY
jgi:hypothetical protein